MTVHARRYPIHSDDCERPLRRHRATLALVLCVAGTSSACVRTPRSYSPVGASALYGDRTEDGVTLLLHLEPPAAMARVREELQATGYELADTAADGAGQTVRTRAHVVGGDTLMVVTAQVIRVELPEVVSSVVLTATFDVPSRGVRNAPVIQKPGTVSPLYARLKTVAERVGGSRAPAPDDRQQARVLTAR